MVVSLYRRCVAATVIELARDDPSLVEEVIGAVQGTMIGFGLYRGERFRGLQAVALMFALGKLIGLLLPGLSALPLRGALLMLATGVAWASIRCAARAAATRCS